MKDNLRLILPWLKETNEYFGSNWEIAISKAKDYADKTNDLDFNSEKAYKKLTSGEKVLEKLPYKEEKNNFIKLYYIIDLTSAAAMKKEGDLMAHCVGADFNVEELKEGFKFYSLREVIFPKNNKTDYSIIPKATMRINPYNELVELKGKANEKITKEPYKSLIFNFLKKHEINFHPSAFSDYFHLIEDNADNFNELVKNPIKEKINYIISNKINKDSDANFELNDLLVEIRSYKNGEVFKKLKSEIKQLLNYDPTFVTSIITKGNKEFISEILKENSTSMDEILKNNPESVELLSKDLLPDYIDSFYSILKDSDKPSRFKHTLKHIPDEKLDIDLLLEISKKDPEILIYHLNNPSIQEKINLNEVVSNIVDQYKSSLVPPKEFIKVLEELNDLDLIKKLLIKIPYFYGGLPKRLRENQEIIDQYFKQVNSDIYLLRYISSKFLEQRPRFILTLAKSVEPKKIFELYDIISKPYTSYFDYDNTEEKYELKFNNDFRKKLLKIFLEREPKLFPLLSKNDLKLLNLNDEEAKENYLKVLEKSSSIHEANLNLIPKNWWTQSFIQDLLNILFNNRAIQKQLKLKAKSYYKEIDNQKDILENQLSKLIKLQNDLSLKYDITEPKKIPFILDSIRLDLEEFNHLFANPVYDNQSNRIFLHAIHRYLPLLENSRRGKHQDNLFYYLKEYVEKISMENTDIFHQKLIKLIKETREFTQLLAKREMTKKIGNKILKLIELIEEELPEINNSFSTDISFKQNIINTINQNYLQKMERIKDNLKKIYSNKHSFFDFSKESISHIIKNIPNRYHQLIKDKMENFYSDIKKVFNKEISKKYF